MIAVEPAAPARPPASPVAWACPACGNRLKLAVEHLGQVGECPHCGRRVRPAPLPARTGGRIGPIPLSVGAARAMLARRFSWKKAALAAGAILFAWFVWPTPYRYEPWKGELLRMNRFTGQIQLLKNPVEGWTPR